MLLKVFGAAHLQSGPKILVHHKVGCHKKMSKTEEKEH